MHLANLEVGISTTRKRFRPTKRLGCDIRNHQHSLTKGGKGRNLTWRLHQNLAPTSSDPLSFGVEVVETAGLGEEKRSLSSVLAGWGLDDRSEKCPPELESEFEAGIGCGLGFEEEEVLDWAEVMKRKYLWIGYARSFPHPL